MQDKEQELRELAKGLRRELRRLDTSAAELGHTQVLELLARALGARTWAGLLARQSSSASEPEASTPTVALSNRDGRFNFVADGRVLTGRFRQVQGTCDDIFGCIAQVDLATQQVGKLHLPYDGDTEVAWNAQRTRLDSRGVRLWVDEDGNVVPEDELILVPDDVPAGAFVRDEGAAPVRQALVGAYLAYLATAPAGTTLAQAADVLRFALTPDEMRVVQAAQAGGRR